MDKITSRNKDIIYTIKTENNIDLTIIRKEVKTDRIAKLVLAPSRAEYTISFGNEVQTTLLDTMASAVDLKIFLEDVKVLESNLSWLPEMPRDLDCINDMLSIIWNNDFATLVKAKKYTIKMPIEHYENLTRYPIIANNVVFYHKFKNTMIDFVTKETETTMLEYFQNSLSKRIVSEFEYMLVLKSMFGESNALDYLKKSQDLMIISLDACLVSALKPVFIENKKLNDFEKALKKSKFEYKKFSDYMLKNTAKYPGFSVVDEGSYFTFAKLWLSCLYHQYNTTNEITELYPIKMY